MISGRNCWNARTHQRARPKKAGLLSFFPEITHQGDSSGPQQELDPGNREIPGRKEGVPEKALENFRDREENRKLSLARSLPWRF